MEPEEEEMPMEPEKQAMLMSMMVIGGGYEVGMMTNPDSKDRPNFIEINGEKVVCLAQGGECRVPGEFYCAGGLNNPDSWKTPIISHTCPNTCSDKWLVCEGHDHKPGENVHEFIINPYRNKFAGQFSRFCKDFDRIKTNHEESDLMRKVRGSMDSFDPNDPNYEIGVDGSVTYFRRRP